MSNSPATMSPTPNVA